MKKMKRFTSFSLCLVLVLSLILQNNSIVRAADNTKAKAEVTKSVTWKDISKGIATVELKVKATGSTYEYKEPAPTNIVLVLDASNSMKDNNRLSNAKNAAKAFATALLNSDKNTNGNIKIAVVSFNKTAAVVSNFTNNLSSVKDKIDSIQASKEGTNIQAGIKKAEELFANAGNGNKYMVLLSDGEPTFSYKVTGANFTVKTVGYNCFKLFGIHECWVNDYDFTVTGVNYNSIVGNGEDYYIDYEKGMYIGQVEIHCPHGKDVHKESLYPNHHGGATKFEADQAKKAGITCYTIGYGIGNGSIAQSIMKYIASDSSKYFTSQISNSEITKIFNSIQQSITKDISAGKDGVLTSKSNDIFIKNGTTRTDVDYSVLADTIKSSTGKASVSSNKVTWNIGELEAGTYTLTYDIQIDLSKAKDVNTIYVDESTLNYKEYNADGSATSNKTVNSNQGELEFFRVTFKDADGTVLKTQIVGKGDNATPPETPHKIPDSQYTYEFDKWVGNYKNVQKDEVVIAHYKAIKRTYTVEFFIDGNPVGEPQIVEVGSAATEPTYEYDATRNYTPWDKDFSNVQSNMEVHRTSVQTYTVQFYIDGNPVGEPQRVEEGQAAIEPTYEYDPTRNYTPWDKDFSNVQSNMEVHRTSVQTYTVQFYIDGNPVGEPQRIEEGQAAIEPTYEYDPTRNYTPWDKDFSNVQSNLEVMRTSSIKTFTVTFINHDGTELDTDTVTYGSAATYKGSTPTKASDDKYSYTFNGWDKDFSNVTTDLTVVATYEAKEIIPEETTPAGPTDNPAPQPTQEEKPVSTPTPVPEQPTVDVPDDDTPANPTKQPTVDVSDDDTPASGTEKPAVNVPDDDTPASGNLPKTGTMPVDVFYLAGGMLVLFGASILMVKKGKRA